MRKYVAAILIAGLGTVAPAAAEEAAPPPPPDDAVAHNQFTFAYRLVQLGELETAARAFDEFLGRFPDDEKLGDALYFRALIAWMQNNHRTAAWYLGKLGRTTLVPESDVHLLRGQVAYGTGQFDEALRDLAAIDPRTLDSPAVAANVLLTRAACYQRLEKVHAAESVLKQAAEIDGPLRARALLELAKVQQQLDETDAALATLEAAAALQDPQVTPEATFLAAESLSARADYAQALQRYQVVVERHAASPRFAAAVLGTLWCQARLGQDEQLLASVAQYRDALDPATRVLAWDLAASAYQRKGDHQTAAAWLQSILSTAPGSAIEDRVQYKLARSQYALGQYAAMAETVARLVAAHPDSTHCQDADLLLASADAKQGRQDLAEARYSRIIDAGRAHRHYAQALVQRAWLYESQGQLAAAIGDCRRFQAERLATDPEQDHDVALRLMGLYSRSGALEDSAEQARRLVGWNRPRPEAPLDPLLQQRVLYDLAQSLIRLRQYPEAHEVLAELLDRHPLTGFRPDALYYDGMVLMSLARNDEAVVRFGEALACEALGLAQRINALRLSALHLRTAGHDDNASQMLLLLDELTEGKGLQPPERLWLGRYLHGQARYELALRLLGPLVGRDPAIDGRMREEALLLTARCRRGTGDREAALAAYDQVIAMAGSSDLRSWEEKADTLRELGRFERALEEYEGLLNQPETDVAARAAFHAGLTQRALARKRKLDADPPGSRAAQEQARRLLLRVVILYSKPELAPLPELAHIELAEVEAELNDRDSAKQRYRDLDEKFPGGPYALYARAMLAQLDGQRGAATAMLRQLDPALLDGRLAERVRAQLAEPEAPP